MTRCSLIIAAAIVASSVAACSSSTGSSTRSSTAAVEAAANTSPSPAAGPEPPASAPTATTSSAPAGTSAAKRRTAEEDLTRFLAEARKADARLRRAAALINAGIGDDAVRVDPATADAVRAAAPDAAADAVPPGLQSELLQRTLVVYNDLASRHAAMSGFRFAPRTYPMSGEGKDLLRCLANGARATARFAGDLAALQSLARSRPATLTAASDPVSAAGLAVRLARIDSRNTCSDECGANVYTELAPLIWTLKPTAATAGRGELEGITFTTTPQDGGWAVSSDSC
jgi:hypothetical protein